MLETRVIPCLLLQDRGLVKTVNFKNPNYIGDPINTVKIFNDKEVDEIVILDIGATAQNKEPDLELLKEIASEAFMPLTYGGGIKTIEQMHQIFNAGYEKICTSSLLFEKPELIKKAVSTFGAQSVVGCIDVKNNFFSGRTVFTHNGKRAIKKSLEEIINHIKDLEIGELIVNSITKDGTLQGYDHELIKQVSEKMTIPVIPVGGASGLADFSIAVKNGASAVAAGSFFVYNGIHKAVLISYPQRAEIEKLFTNKGIK